MKRFKGLGLIPAVLSLTGCLDPSRVVFFTSDNLGVNISSLPQPTAEITYARTENVLEPGFEDGTVPSVAAAVQHKVENVWKFSQDSRAIFAGNNAARFVSGDINPVIDLRDLSTGTDAEKLKNKHLNANDEFTNGISSVACVRELPPTIFNPSEKSQEADKTRQNQARSFYQAELLFGTDTTIGFKISVPATTASASFPSAHLGYNRIEYAFAPIFGKKYGCIKTNKDGDPVDIDGKLVGTANGILKSEDFIGVSDKPDGVYTPSFLAMIGTAQKVADLSPPDTSAWGVGQVFATGKSAEVISKYGNVYGSVARIASSFIPSSGPFATAFLKVRQKELSDVVGNLDSSMVPKYAKALNLIAPNNNIPDIQKAINNTTDLGQLERIHLKLQSVI